MFTKILIFEIIRIIYQKQILIHLHLSNPIVYLGFKSLQLRALVNLFNFFITDEVFVDETIVWWRHFPCDLCNYMYRTITLCVCFFIFFIFLFWRFVRWCSPQMPLQIAIKRQSTHLQFKLVVIKTVFVVGNLLTTHPKFLFKIKI